MTVSDCLRLPSGWSLHADEVRRARDGLGQNAQKIWSTDARIAYVIKIWGCFLCNSVYLHSAPRQCHSTVCTLPSKLSVMYSVFPSGPPNVQLVKLIPGEPLTILALGTPCLSTTKTEPRLGWQMSTLPSSSNFMPSGPALPKERKKTPAFDVEPSGCSGSLHTSFDLVIAT